MSALRRTRAGLFTEAGAHTMEEILAAKQAGPDALQALLLPVERVFDPLPLLTVEERTAAHLYNGCPTSHYPAPDGRYRVRGDGEGRFLGLARSRAGCFGWKKLFVERT